MGLGNKAIFSKNLRRYMDATGKTRKDMCDALGFSYTTFSDWYNGTKYPRIDKIEMMANYFGILKSDLIEEKKDAESVEQALVDEYTLDPQIRRLVLYAGGIQPGEARDKYVDAILLALRAMCEAGKK